MPAEADVVEGFAEESDETHTLWISRGDGSNGGNRKKFAWTWTLVRCPRGGRTVGSGRVATVIE